MKRTKLEELKAAYEATPKADFIYAPGFANAVFIVRDGLLKTVADMDKIDSEFIALAHNLMPDLIKAAEELRIAAYMIQNEYPEQDENWQRAQQMLDLLEKFK